MKRLMLVVPLSILLIFVLLFDAFKSFKDALIIISNIPFAMIGGIFALLLTGMVVFVNLGLRPLVKFLKRHTKAGVPVTRSYRVMLTCAGDKEASMRALLLRCLTLGGLHLQEIVVKNQDDGLEITALVGGEDAPELAVEQAVQRMAAETGVGRVRWMAADEI